MTSTEILIAGSASNVLDLRRYFFLKVARKRLFEELIYEQRPEEDSFGKSTYVRQSKHPQSGENLARLRNKKVPVDQKEVFQVLFEG